MKSNYVHADFNQIRLLAMYFGGMVCVVRVELGMYQDVWQALCRTGHEQSNTLVFENSLEVLQEKINEAFFSGQWQRLHIEIPDSQESEALQIWRYTGLKEEPADVSILAPLEGTESIMPERQQVPALDKRPETGPMRFGDDWTGIFLRGDSAMGYRASLLMAQECLEGRYKTALQGLIDLLGKADEQNFYEQNMAETEAANE